MRVHATKSAFARDVSDLADDTRTQLDALGRCDAQTDRLAALEVRISGGRDRAAVLSARVDAVRARVEGWERADRVCRERTRRRLRVLWVAMIVLAGVLALLALGVLYAPPPAAVEEAVKAVDGRLGGMLKNLTSGTNGGGRTKMGKDDGSPSTGADDLLRVFDEL